MPSSPRAGKLLRAKMCDYEGCPLSGGQDVISVAELDRRLRRAVEGSSANVWVEGEVASLKRAPSGHAYFTLKDERDDAIIECVMYKFYATRFRRLLLEGARLQLRGKATVWPPRGRLQFVAEGARAAGRGALLEALEKLKARLAAEGLFAAERKRPLPADPRVVGVVTSASGAAFHDIRTVAFRRCSVRLVLCSALVQGDGAAESLVAALDLIEQYPGLDVLIVGRGGGSGEDLMAFNDERVVRRVAAAKVPVVSAVGHETDVTLTDLAADVRAATPSQAAELVCPNLAERAEALRRCRAALLRAWQSEVVLARNRLHRLEMRLGDPRFLIAERQEQLDELSERLRQRTRRTLSGGRGESERLLRRLLARHPRTVIATSRAELGPLRARLQGAMRYDLGAERARLSDAAARLHSLSPLAVLGRGYAIATRADGVALRRAREVAPGDPIELRLAEGGVSAAVTAVRPATEDE